MGIASQVSLLLVLVLGILSSPLYKRRGQFLLRRCGGWTLGIPAFIMAGVALYRTHAQFIAWQGDAISKYLLPPYHSLDYFVSYAAMHFWASYGISFIMALAIYIIAAWANARRGGIFFEKEEIYFLALGIFLTGHPGWILYLLVVLIAYVIYSVFAALIFQSLKRVSFYYFWLPCAAATILAGAYMTQFSWYNNLFI